MTREVAGRYEPSSSQSSLRTSCRCSQSFGSAGWNGSTTRRWSRAVIRRGTDLSEPLLEYPWILQIAQYGIVLFELSSPLLLAPGRLGKRFLIGAVVFHIVTFATIGIIFLPHVMCLLSFVELERFPTPAPDRLQAVMRRMRPSRS